MRTSVLIAACGLLAASAQATVRYVNKDSACPGTGATGTPYCSIQNAVSAAVAGDDIRIRKASTPYNESVTTHSSGTSSAQITIESDDHANQPVWYYIGNGAFVGALEIPNSYWTVQYLDFDGTGVFSSGVGIHITNGSSSGNQVLHTTIRNWGGTMAQRGTTVSVTGISLAGNAPVIQFDTFDGVARFGIDSSAANHALIDSNEFKNAQCGHDPDGAFIENGVHMIDANGNGTLSYNNTISNNTFHDFQNPSTCTIGAVGDFSAIHVDVGPINGMISGNTFYNLDVNNVANGGSNVIWVEQDVHGWTVQNNIIYDVGGNGIVNYGGPTTGAVNRYFHNTVYGNGFGARGYCFRLAGGYAVFENNACYGGALDSDIVTEDKAVSGFAISGNLTIDYNIYWDASGGSRVGVWNTNNPFTTLPALNFASWKSACNCDSHSINANPLFVNPPADFHLQSSSPALTSGLGGTFMGALGTSGVSVPNPPTGLTATVQ